MRNNRSQGHRREAINTYARVANDANEDEHKKPLANSTNSTAAMIKLRFNIRFFEIEPITSQQVPEDL